MKPVAATLAVSMALLSGWSSRRVAAQASAGPWRFLVSGDARNCGDVIAPAIASTATARQVAFYWHLGDLRWGSDVDQDIRSQPEHVKTPMTVSAYMSGEWPDFIANQIDAFGAIPYFVGIGNHELVAPKTRQDYIIQFADWLNSPVIRNQRLKDDPTDHIVKTYYHWIDRGVDFIFLDNASNEMIDAAEMRWFEKVLALDASNPSVVSIVVGMHKPLPDTFAGNHSMNESPQGIESGHRVYADLLKSQNDAHKRVYILASHQHFYMEDVFSNDYWKQHGGVLPGWVVGTAGATRYALPSPLPKVAITNVYGSLMGTVSPDGSIAFEFRRINETDIPAAVVDRYGSTFVHWCFAENTNVK
jgi:hypothetical protein